MDSTTGFKTTSPDATDFISHFFLRFLSTWDNLTIIYAFKKVLKVDISVIRKSLTEQMEADLDKDYEIFKEFEETHLKGRSKDRELMDILGLIKDPDDIVCAFLRGLREPKILGLETSDKISDSALFEVFFTLFDAKKFTSSAKTHDLQLKLMKTCEETVSFYKTSGKVMEDLFLTQCLQVLDYFKQLPEDDAQN
jgi:hypothetical protein